MPEPTPAEQAKAGADARLSDSPPMVGYGAATYTGRPEGPGRWFLIESHGNTLGWLWTNDTDGLGFLPTTPEGIQYQPEFTQAFSGAYQAEVHPGVIFDAWAERAGLGLAARTVETGDLGDWFQHA